MPFRIGIVGARRSRQGAGEYVAAHLAALGAEVAAVVGTRRETAEEARRHLKARYGIAVRPYTSLRNMLAEERLHAIAICSPQECHREHLEQAMAAGIHALCEKPLLFNPGRDPVDDARPLVEGFAAAGKVLMVNEQWPYTLRAFQELYPGYPLGKRPVQELTVLLSPSDVGAEMIPNSLPHALSLLFALAPGSGQVEGLQVHPRNRQGDAATAGDVHFAYRHSGGMTDVSVLLRHATSQPRPAAYEIDGHGVWRQIRIPLYEMWLTSGPLSARVEGASTAGGVDPQRQVGMEDPLPLSLADFLNRCKRASQGAELKKDTTILQRLAILRDVYAMARQVL